jgi:DNA-binding FrmR family transcriptional regulator
MTAMNSNPIKQRLLSAGGHLEAVTAMVDSNISAEIVVFQLYAIQGAIKAITQSISKEHIEECLEVLTSSSSEEESRKALDSLLSIYSWSITKK